MFGAAGRIGKGWGIWLLVCLLVLCRAPVSEAEVAEQWTTIQYVYNDILFQPVVIQANDEIDTRNLDLFFDKEGYVSPAIWQYLSPRLTDGQEVVDMDVSEGRILLCMLKNDGIILRIAQWNKALNDYTITDTGLLPCGSELDTYHDANAVMVSIPSIEAATEDGKAEQEDEYLYLTFQQLEDGWYLTNFTDGQSFAAALCEDTYLFDDYYEPNPANAWTAYERILFEDFSVTELWFRVQEYQEARQQCNIHD